MRQKDEAAHRSILERDRFIDLSDPAIVRAPSEEAIRAFYDSWEWKRCRYDVMQGKRLSCMACGADRSDGVKIVADHIKPLRWYWNRRLDSKNIQILCQDCNMGKGSRSQSDFRSPSEDEQCYVPQAAYGLHRDQVTTECQIIMTYLGAQGCKTRYIGTQRDLIRIAELTFDFPPNLTVPECADQVLAIGRKERCARGEKNVPRYWPEPCDLWPPESLSRVRAAAKKSRRLANV